ncbi:MAG TPA: hypothetical protein VED84_06855 [Acidimicrobiales bacterium]|nr:hypothetical protein [Acidimicrobiales bacterium]
MKASLSKRLAAAVVALGLAGGVFGLTAGTALATTRPSTIKAGAPCAKANLGKTKTVGKTTYVCKKVGTHYKWEKK